MADRQDIDALMVGALYGELDAAQSARLETHLSSHPEDRAAMQGLEQTRAAVRQGLADLPAAEPPQAISALLLQAAARRAPARAASAAEPVGDGPWARFVDWFRRGAMHPAVGAAAVLVLVAGTATALWVRGKGDVTEPTAPSSAAPERAVLDRAAPPPAEPPHAGLAAPGADLYDVDTADREKLLGAEPPADGVAAQDKTFGRGRTGGSGDRIEPPRERDTRQPATGYLEVERASKTPRVKDLPSEDDALKLDLPSDDRAAAPESRRNEEGVGGSASGGATAKAAAPIAEPRAVDPALEQWARSAHARLVKLVSDGKCPDAGRLGADIKDRAPEYYASSVANDRAIRQCKQYIESQAKKKAEKAYKSRSQQNTYDADTVDAPTSK